MLQLTTLGTLRLDRDGVPLTGAAAQRLRLVVLAVLAASPRGMSRESLAALLWGDRDEEHARHSLEQALYGLKRSLGADPVHRTSTTLQLDSAVVRADVTLFDAAIGTGEWEGAVSVYGGGFLEGVFLSDAPEFERWSERERARRREAYLRALEECARQALARQVPGEGVRWWRRLHGENPLSTRVVLELARALAATGEHGDALRVAEDHAARLAAETGTGKGAHADPELGKLIAALRGPPANERVSPTGAPIPSTGSEVLSVELSEALGASYRIEGNVGSSRIYQAFRVRHVKSGRLVSVKVLDPSIVRFTDRRVLCRELERAAALRHEHLVGHEAVGTTPNLVYLIGPDDDGEMLRERLTQRGELAVADALSLTRQVGSALLCAHENGVLHLDVTPKRILLSKRGAVLRDIGVVSAILSAASGGSGQRNDETGVLLGTAAYMAPEVALARGSPNEQSDLFSFAAVVFQALTGALPYGIAGAGAQPRAAVPSAATIRSTVPRSVDAALARALAPVRSDRQSSIAAFLSEIPPS